MPSIFSVSYKLNTLQSNSIADVWILWHYWQQQFCSTLTYVQHIKPDKMTTILNKIITCHSHNSRKLFFSLFVKGKRTEQINLLSFMKVPLSPKWYLLSPLQVKSTVLLPLQISFLSRTNFQHHLWWNTAEITFSYHVKKKITHHPDL